ncbi:MAG: cadherin-like domain-containing protein, partial [Akkermansiaceae bacterium]|nr:cadherin-like domain-containing protein [Akkermansiaceae bacterium]
MTHNTDILPPPPSPIPKRIRPQRMVCGLLMAVLGLGAPSALADNRLSTVSVPSVSMSKSIDTAIMLPTSYASNPGRRYSVIYFLDGYNTGGRDGIRIFYDWYKYDLLRLCDQYDVIMVAVGCVNKWYFDSPVDPTVRWQTFLTNELIPYVDANYRSVGTRQGRAITGLSMGGHGALYTAFRHTDTFIAAGSTSGGVDFRPWPTNWDIAAVLGAKATNQSAWDANVVVNNLSALPTAGMQICFDCGTSDFFLDVNRALDQKLTTNAIPHTYTEYPGGHTMDYWQGTFPKHVVFFSKYLAGITRGSVVMRQNTTKTFATANYPFANAGNPTNAIKVVTSLPSHGTLTLSGTPVTLGTVVSAASIGTLTYTPATNYIGTDSFNFQVSDDGTTFSTDAVMGISVASNTAVMNGSFETPGTTQSGPWATFGSPWTGNPAANYYQQVQVVPPYSTDYTATVDNGMWAAVLTSSSATAAIPLSQSLPKTVSAADTLSVTFALGRPQSAAAGGQCVAYFQVGSTKYTTTFDTSSFPAGTWRTYTMTKQISNSGNLSVGFYWISGNNSNLDSISEVSVTPGVVDSNAPSLNNPVLPAMEDAVTPLSAGSLGYTDPNSVALAAVQITALPALGTLKNGGAILGSGNLPLTVAVADLGNLTYQSALDGSGVPYTTIGIKVMNANNLWSLPATMTVNVTPVNDAPTSAGGAVSMAKSTVRTFAAADFPFADVDSGDTLQAIKVTSLPTHGTLNVSNATAIPVANIGTLSYTPTPGYTGADSFNYQVSDGTTFSTDATMALSIIDGTIIPVINGNFETEYGSNTDKTINWVKLT